MEYKKSLKEEKEEFRNNAVKFSEDKTVTQLKEYISEVKKGELFVEYRCKAQGNVTEKTPLDFLEQVELELRKKEEIEARNAAIKISRNRTAREMALVFVSVWEGKEGLPYVDKEDYIRIAFLEQLKNEFEKKEIEENNVK